MLAESLEAMRPLVEEQLAARAGASGRAPVSRPSELLDDLVAALRRGRVERAPVPSGEEAAACLRDAQRARPGEDPRRQVEALMNAYGLVGECIHDLVERQVLQASPRELRLLAEWLCDRTCAPALALAAGLGEQNRRMAAVLDAVPDPLSVVNRDGRLCYLNRASREVAHAVSGVAADAIAGGSWRELGYPSSSVRAYDEALARAGAGSTVTTELLYPTPDGARWFEHKVSPIYREDGSLASFAAISRDIDDRKRAQTRLSLLSKLGALRGSLEYGDILPAVARLSIPELADWCMVDVLQDGEVRIAEVAHRDPNQAALARALPRLAIHHPLRRKLPAAQALETRRPVLVPEYTLELLREQTEGEYLELLQRIGVRSAIAIPVALPGSLAVMTFLVTAESGRRYSREDLALAEELARRAAQIVEGARVHQQLRQTEERFRVALAHSKIAVFEQDPDLRYRWIYNPQFGYGEADVLGRTSHEILRPGEAFRLAELSRDVLRTGHGVREEIQLTGAGGEARHLLLALEPLRDGSGALTGITGAASDITDQKRAQEELAQALVFREQVMGILGHDLRNPLGAVRVLASLLLRREGLPEDMRESLEEIDRAGKRMHELIESLLDFSESRVKGILPVAPAPTDLHELCRSVIEELLAAEPGRAIDVDLEGDGRGAWDPARLAQVVSNLVGNALKHGARYEPVRVSVRDGEEEIVLKVENQGPVISPELLPVLFEPFHRGQVPGEVAHDRGLGLGLYIVRQIVDAHGGSIAVESTAERGTTFTVRLPRANGARIAQDRGGWVPWMNAATPAGA